MATHVPLRAVLVKGFLFIAPAKSEVKYPVLRRTNIQTAIAKSESISS